MKSYATHGAREGLLLLVFAFIFLFRANTAFAQGIEAREPFYRHLKNLELGALGFADLRVESIAIRSSNQQPGFDSVDEIDNLKIGPRTVVRLAVRDGLVWEGRVGASAPRNPAAELQGTIWWRGGKVVRADIRQLSARLGGVTLSSVPWSPDVAPRVFGGPITFVEALGPLHFGETSTGTISLTIPSVSMQALDIRLSDAHVRGDARGTNLQFDFDLKSERLAVSGGRVAITSAVNASTESLVDTADLLDRVSLKSAALKMSQVDVQLAPGGKASATVGLFVAHPAEIRVQAREDFDVIAFDSVMARDLSSGEGSWVGGNLIFPKARFQSVAVMPKDLEVIEQLNLVSNVDQKRYLVPTGNPTVRFITPEALAASYSLLSSAVSRATAASSKVPTSAASAEFLVDSGVVTGVQVTSKDGVARVYDYVRIDPKLEQEYAQMAISFYMPTGVGGPTANFVESLIRIVAGSPQSQAARISQIKYLTPGLRPVIFAAVKSTRQTIKKLTEQSAEEIFGHALDAAYDHVATPIGSVVAPHGLGSKDHRVEAIWRNIAELPQRLVINMIAQTASLSATLSAAHQSHAEMLNAYDTQRKQFAQQQAKQNAQTSAEQDRKDQQAKAPVNQGSDVPGGIPASMDSGPGGTSGTQSSNCGQGVTCTMTPEGTPRSK